MVPTIEWGQARQYQLRDVACFSAKFLTKHLEVRRRGETDEISDLSSCKLIQMNGSVGTEPPVTRPDQRPFDCTKGKKGTVGRGLRK